MTCGSIELEIPQQQFSFQSQDQIQVNTDSPDAVSLRISCRLCQIEPSTQLIHNHAFSLLAPATVMSVLELCQELMAEKAAVSFCLIGQSVRLLPMKQAGREAAADLPGAVRGLVPRNYLAQDKYS